MKSLVFHLPPDNEKLHEHCDALTLLGYSWSLNTSPGKPPAMQFVERDQTFFTAILAWELEA